MGAENPAFTTHSQVAPGDLVIATHDLYTDPAAVIASGQNLGRGALVGLISASSKYVLSLSASSDGSQVPVGVLLTDIDASGGDKSVPNSVALMGAFDTTKMTFGTGHTAASTRRALAARGIALYTPADI